MMEGVKDQNKGRDIPFSLIEVSLFSRVLLFPT
jgi:hypothetical protein